MNLFNLSPIIYGAWTTERYDFHIRNRFQKSKSMSNNNKARTNETGDCPLDSRAYVLNFTKLKKS